MCSGWRPDAAMSEMPCILKECQRTKIVSTGMYGARNGALTVAGSSGRNVSLETK